MKKTFLLTTMVAASMALTGTSEAAPIFPRAGTSTLGPALTITLTDNGPTIITNSNQTYDGSDDVEIALINASSSTQTFITLSGSGNGGGIFAFDGDGISQYTDANTGMLTIGNAADPTGYAGPGVTFSNTNAGGTSGQVNFNLAPGASTYFSLEGSPNSITTGGGIIIGGGSGSGNGGAAGGGGATAVPEPSSVAVIATGLLGLLLYRRRA